MSFNYSPIVITDGLVFYTDPFNFKSRSRNIGLTGGSIVDLTSSYDFSGTFINEPEISSNYKYITFDGTDDEISFPQNATEEIQRQQPYVRYKPKEFTISVWVKSGSTGGGGAIFWGGANDYWLDIPPLTATTYTNDTYTGVVGEIWSGNSAGVYLLDLPTFKVEVSGGTIIRAVAETAVGSFPNGISEQAIIKISGNTIGGTTPTDDAYFTWKAASSSTSRWGLQIGSNYGLVVSDSIDKGVFATDRVSNEPKKWNLLTVTDIGQSVADNLSCYINGELVNTGTGLPLNGSQQDPGTITAGQIFLGKGNSSTFSTYLNGSLGTIMLYDRALSQTEIQRNYNALKGRFGL